MPLKDLFTKTAGEAPLTAEEVKEKAEEFKEKAEEFISQFKNGACPEPPKDENGNPVAPPDFPKDDNGRPAFPPKPPTDENGRPVPPPFGKKPEEAVQVAVQETVETVEKVAGEVTEAL